MAITGSVETQVNTTALRDQNNPQIVALSDGSWVVAWLSQSEDLSNWDIVQQVYSANGTKRGGEVNTTSNSPNRSQGEFLITALSSGGWLLTSETIDNGSHNLIQQAYNATGQVTAMWSNVNTHSPLQTPVVLTLLDGGWLTSWILSSGDGTSTCVVQQRHTSAGVPVGLETRVDEFQTGYSLSPITAVLKNGGWVVSWAHKNDDNSALDVFQQAYNASGARVGNQTQVNTFAEGNQIPTDILALADGGWVVIVSSEEQDGSYRGIFQTIYNFDGSKRGGESQVNTYTESDQTYSDATAITGGGWVVTWTSYEQDGDHQGVFQQAYNSNGSKLGTEHQINVYTHKAQQHPKVTALTDGGWVVTWVSNGQDGSGYGIYQQAFSAAGAKLGTETAVNAFTTGDQINHKVTALDGGGWVVTWTSPSQDIDGSGVFQRIFHYENEAPQSIALSKATVAENSAVGTAIGTFSAVDPEGKALTYTLTDNAGGLFKLFGKVLQLAKTVDYETLKSDTVTVRVSDGVKTTTKTFTVSIGDINEVPSPPTLSKTAVAENSAVGTTIGVLASIDPEGKTLTYKLTDTAAGLFKLSGYKLQLAKTVDYEKLKSDTITVEVSDGVIKTLKTFTVGISDVNEVPTSVALSKMTVAENTKVGTTVGTFSAIDPEGKALTYKLTDTAGGLFKLDGNRLQLAKGIDYEKVHGDTITVQIKDAGGLTVTKTFKIGVIDVLETITGSAKAETLKGGIGADKIIAGAGSDKIQGLAGNDLLYGDAGNDSLFGDIGDDVIFGGLGVDNLTGGAGRDTFVFNTALSASINIDTITDYNVVSDTIQLENVIFNTLKTTGVLSAAAFVKNATGVATDSSDRIIYETDTGKLFYDRDGNGSAFAGVQFAKLAPGLTLTNADFFII